MTFTITFFASPLPKATLESFTDNIIGPVPKFCSTVTSAPIVKPKTSKRFVTAFPPVKLCTNTRDFALCSLKGLTSFACGLIRSNFVDYLHKLFSRLFTIPRIKFPNPCKFIILAMDILVTCGLTVFNNIYTLPYAHNTNVCKWNAFFI